MKKKTGFVAAVGFIGASMLGYFASNKSEPPAEPLPDTQPEVSAPAPTPAATSAEDEMAKALTKALNKALALKGLCDATNKDMERLQPKFDKKIERGYREISGYEYAKNNAEKTIDILSNSRLMRNDVEALLGTKKEYNDIASKMLSTFEREGGSIIAQRTVLKDGLMQREEAILGKTDLDTEWKPTPQDIEEKQELKELIEHIIDVRITVNQLSEEAKSMLIEASKNNDKSRGFDLSVKADEGFDGVIGYRVDVRMDNSNEPKITISQPVYSPNAEENKYSREILFTNDANAKVGEPEEPEKQYSVQRYNAENDLGHLRQTVLNYAEKIEKGTQILEDKKDDRANNTWLEYCRTKDPIKVVENSR